MTCAAETYRAGTRNGTSRRRELDNTVVAIIRQKPYSEAVPVGRPNLTLGHPQRGVTLTIIGFRLEEPTYDSRYQLQIQGDGSSGGDDNSQNTVIKRTHIAGC